MGDGGSYSAASTIKSSSELKHFILISIGHQPDLSAYQMAATFLELPLFSLFLENTSWEG